MGRGRLWTEEEERALAIWARSNGIIMARGQGEGPVTLRRRLQASVNLDPLLVARGCIPCAYHLYNNWERIRDIAENINNIENRMRNQ